MTQTNQNPPVFLLNKFLRFTVVLRPKFKKKLKIDPKEFFSSLQLADGSLEARNPFAKHFQGDKGCKFSSKTNIKTEKPGKHFLRDSHSNNFMQNHIYNIFIVTNRVTKSVTTKIRLNILTHKD